MDAIITGDSERIGLSVIDDNDVEHLIEMDENGEIKYHEQDGYPDDPTERTSVESEYIGQARNYARYHVYEETEYEPFPVEKNLPGIERVKDAIEDLPVETVEQYFGDLFKQVNGKSPRIDRPVPRPEPVGENDYLLAMIDVYLDNSGTIDAVSDIHLRYYDRDSDLTEQWGDDPLPERTPDARLQLVEDYVPSMELFQEYLVYHLRCQLRDCYIGAGMEPPDQYKVIGYGIDALVGRYKNPDIPIYEQYHEHKTEIPGYELEFDYGLGFIGKLASKFESLERQDPELKDAIDTFLGDGDTSGQEELESLLEARGYGTTRTQTDQS